MSFMMMLPSVLILIVLVIPSVASLSVFSPYTTSGSIPLCVAFNTSVLATYSSPYTQYSLTFANDALSLYDPLGSTTGSCALLSDLSEQLPPLSSCSTAASTLTLSFASPLSYGSQYSFCMLWPGNANARDNTLWYSNTTTWTLTTKGNTSVVLETLPFTQNISRVAGYQPLNAADSGIASFTMAQTYADIVNAMDEFLVTLTISNSRVFALGSSLYVFPWSALGRPVLGYGYQLASGLFASYSTATVPCTGFTPYQLPPASTCTFLSMDAGALWNYGLKIDIPATAYYSAQSFSSGTVAFKFTMPSAVNSTYVVNNIASLIAFDSVSSTFSNVLTTVVSVTFPSSPLSLTVNSITNPVVGQTNTVGLSVKTGALMRLPAGLVVAVKDPADSVISSCTSSALVGTGGSITAATNTGTINYAASGGTSGIMLSPYVTSSLQCSVTNGATYTGRVSNYQLTASTGSGYSSTITVSNTTSYVSSPLAEYGVAPSSLIPGARSLVAFSLTIPPSLNGTAAAIELNSTCASCFVNCSGFGIIAQSSLYHGLTPLAATCVTGADRRSITLYFNNGEDLSNNFVGFRAYATNPATAGVATTWSFRLLDSSLRPLAYQAVTSYVTRGSTIPVASFAPWQAMGNLAGSTSSFLVAYSPHTNITNQATTLSVSVPLKLLDTVGMGSATVTCTRYTISPVPVPSGIETTPQTVTCSYSGAGLYPGYGLFTVNLLNSNGALNPAGNMVQFNSTYGFILAGLVSNISYVPVYTGALPCIVELTGTDYGAVAFNNASLSTFPMSTMGSVGVIGNMYRCSALSAMGAGVKLSSTNASVTVSFTPNTHIAPVYMTDTLQPYSLRLTLSTGFSFYNPSPSTYATSYSLSADESTQRATLISSIVGEVTSSASRLSTSTALVVEFNGTSGIVARAGQQTAFTVFVNFPSTARAPTNLWTLASLSPTGTVVEQCTFLEPAINVALVSASRLPLTTANVLPGAALMTPVKASYQSAGTGIQDVMDIYAGSGLLFPRKCDYSVFSFINETFVNNTLVSCAGNLSRATVTYQSNSTSTTTVSLQAWSSSWTSSSVDPRIVLTADNGANSSPPL